VASTFPGLSFKIRQFLIPRAFLKISKYSNITLSDNAQHYAFRPLLTAVPSDLESRSKRFRLSPYLKKTAVTFAVGSQTRVISYALFDDDPFLPGRDAVSLGFSDYRRFKHVAPKRRESIPTTVSYTKRCDPQQNRCVNFKPPTLPLSQMLSWVLQVTRTDRKCFSDATDTTRSPYQHGCHNTLTYHAGLFLRWGYAIKLGKWELASRIAYAFLKVCNYPVTTLL